MYSFCRAAWVFFFLFSLATAYWLLWKWGNFMAAHINTDNCEISYCHVSMLVPWKKEHLQGTINSSKRKVEGSYTKPKGNAIQHDCYIIRWWIRLWFVQFTARVEVFSMEFEAKWCFPVGEGEHDIVMLFDLTCWLVSRSCKVFGLIVYAVDFWSECINISACGNKISVS